MLACKKREEEFGLPEVLENIWEVLKTNSDLFQIKSEIILIKSDLVLTASYYFSPCRKMRSFA